MEIPLPFYCSKASRIPADSNLERTFMNLICNPIFLLRLHIQLLYFTGIAINRVGDDSMIALSEKLLNSVT